jgi:hypothetical protein
MEEKETESTDLECLCQGMSPTDSARIVEIASYKPGRNDGHVLAVEPRPETEEMAVPSAPLFSLVHRVCP